MPYPFGTFSKAVPTALAINAAPANGRYCDPACTLWSLCYADNVQRYRPTILEALEKRSETSAALTRYLHDLMTSAAVQRLAEAPWVRFSVFGSFPDGSALTRAQRQLLAKLAKHVDPSRTHFPLETARKYLTYSKLGFEPRLSLGLNPDLKKLRRHADKRCSATIGNPEDKNPGWQARNLDLAKTEARKLRRLGIPTKVCPAIAGSAKCGSCKLCSGSSKFLTLFSLHA